MNKNFELIIQQLRHDVSEVLDRPVAEGRPVLLPILDAKEWHQVNAIRVRAIFVFDTIIAQSVENETKSFSNDLYIKIMKLCYLLDDSAHLSKERRRIRDPRGMEILKYLRLEQKNYFKLRKAQDIIYEVRGILTRIEWFAQQHTDYYPQIRDVIFQRLLEIFRADDRAVSKQMGWAIDGMLLGQLFHDATFDIDFNTEKDIVSIPSRKHFKRIDT
jgi:hypothetical protein